MPKPSVRRFDAFVSAIGVIAAGKLFGCSAATVSHLRREKRTPSRALATRIEKATKRRGTPVLATGWGA